MPNYCVYVLANRNRRIYVGCTRNLPRRLYWHRTSAHPHFTRRYNVLTLVYVEWAIDAMSAIRRERQIKGWTRAKKLALIEAANPTWAPLDQLSWY